MDMRSEKIRLDGLDVEFGDRPIFRQYSLSVKEGEFVALLGVSGSGKTTLLNVIAGFLKPAAGKIEIARQPDGMAASSIGFIFQHDALFPWRTVEGNIAAASSIGSLPHRQRKKQILQFARAVGLEDSLLLYPHELSAGMAQRAEIARALANNPDILLMDEPFSKLDVQTRFALQMLVQDLWLNSRRTVVLVTHDVEEALLLADRLIILTGRPARLAHEITNDLPRPRTIDMIDSDQFVSRKKKIFVFLEEEYERLRAPEAADDKLK